MGCASARGVCVQAAAWQPAESGIDLQDEPDKGGLDSGYILTGERVRAPRKRCRMREGSDYVII